MSRRTTHLIRAIVGAAVLGAAVQTVACFSEHQMATGPTGNVSGDCRIPVTSPIVGSTQAIVAIRNFSFQPATVRVKPGTVVTWVNCEPETVDSHSSKADGGQWNSPFLPPGATYSHTFTAAGQFGYFCEPHPFMRGVVIVE